MTDDAATDELRLRVVTPRGVELDRLVGRVTAESIDGSFTILPRHRDVVAPLTTGLLRFGHRRRSPTAVADGVQEHAVAVDGGTLVKCGVRVDVATRWTVAADTTADLERAWRTMVTGLDERERASRTAANRLEHDLLARLLEAELRP